MADALSVWLHSWQFVLASVVTAFCNLPRICRAVRDVLRTVPEIRAAWVDAFGSSRRHGTGKACSKKVGSKRQCKPGCDS